MGNNCCSGVSGKINDIYELSTGQWDVENSKLAYSKRRLLIMMKNETLKNKNKIDIDMKLTSKLEPLKNDVYYKGQSHSGEDNFVDNIYQPEENSVIFVDNKKEIAKDILPQEIEEIRGLTWHRPSEIFRTYNYYLYKSIEAGDIKQGALGNCYFLSSIAAIAEFKERIEKIFVETETSKNGEYGIRLFVQGVPTIIIVDDFLPCKGKRLFFTHTQGSDNEIWVPLIEKAWAKLNGSYAMTIAGLPSEGLSSMTEAPTVTYIHKKYSADYMWKVLLESDQLDHIICTCTHGNEGLDKVGLVPGHAYTIISLFETKDVRLVKIRNPWGQFEWKGDYSDSSSLWTNELKQLVQYSNQDDGIFYMKFQDFLEYYPYSFICKYERNFHYRYQKFQQFPDETLVGAKITITKPVKIMINLHQHSARTFSEIPNYRNTMSRIILCRYNKNKQKCYEFIKSHASTNEKLHLEFTSLEPGEYHIFTHVNWPYLDYDNTYVISTYAEYPIEVEPVNEDIVPEDFLHMIFYDYLEKNEEKRKLKDNLQLELSLKDNDLGFYMMLFKNTSKDEAHSISFNVDLNKDVRLCTVHPHTEIHTELHDHKNYTMKFSIEPETDYLVLFEVLNEPWYSKINVGKVSVSTQQGMKPDPVKNSLRKHLNKLTKKELDVKRTFIGELENDQYMFLIVFNYTEENIKVQLNLNPIDCINLNTEVERNLIYVEKKEFNYFKFEKLEKGKPVDFTYNYSIKKLLI